MSSPVGALLATVLGSLGTACSDVVVDSIVVERSRNATQVRSCFPTCVMYLSACRRIVMSLSKGECLSCDYYWTDPNVSDQRQSLCWASATEECRQHVLMGSCAKGHPLLMPTCPAKVHMSARRAQQARCSRYAGPRLPLGAWQARISRGASSRRGGLEGSSY